MYVVTNMTDYVYNYLTTAINDSKHLAMNWDTYDADPPNDLARTNAQSIVTCLYSTKEWIASRLYLDTRVVPSSEGGIGIVFHGHADKYADIECFNTGTMLGVISLRGGMGDPIVWTVGADKSLEDSIHHIIAFITT